MAGYLLPSSLHRRIRRLARWQALNISNPKILFNQLVATVRLAPVRKLPSTHSWDFYESFVVLATRDEPSISDTYHLEKLLRGLQAILHLQGSHHDSDELDMTDIEVSQL